MVKTHFSSVPVSPDLKGRLDTFRSTDKGTVSYEKAITALLDFWEDKHK